MLVCCDVLPQGPVTVYRDLSVSDKDQIEHLSVWGCSGLRFAVLEVKIDVVCGFWRKIRMVFGLSTSSGLWFGTLFLAVCGIETLILAVLGF